MIQLRRIFYRRPKGLPAILLAVLALGLAAWARSSLNKAGSTRSLELVETVRLSLPPGKRSARLWVPRLPNDSFQTAELLEVDSPWPHQASADPDFGNPLLYFEPAAVKPGTVEIRLKYRLVRKEQSRPDPQKEPVPALFQKSRCWAEFHVAGRGWIAVDISEAWKQPAKADYYFGNLDPNRVLVSTGREIRLPRRSGPALNYMIRPYAEADGKPFYDIELERRYKDIKGGEKT